MLIIAWHFNLGWRLFFNLFYSVSATELISLRVDPILMTETVYVQLLQFNICKIVLFKANPTYNDACAQPYNL